MGDSETLEVEEGTTIGDLFKELDNRIEVAAREQGKCPECVRFLKPDGTHACMFHVNLENPPNLLDYILQDGDKILIMIGFCGG